jgi:hypothetical protein
VQASLAGRRVCEQQGFKLNMWYLSKVFLEEKPMSTIIIIIFLVVFVSAYIIRVFERQFYSAILEGSDVEIPFESYLNSLWFVIIRVTTVGYGDYCPVTPLGRFFTIIVAFLGTFQMSILIATFSNAIELNKNEQLALIMVNEKKAAINVVVSVQRYASVWRKRYHSE